MVFHVKLRDVKEKKLPELDDEFAKDVSEFDTFEAFKADRAEKMRQRREDIAKQTFENQALRHVVDYMDADIPDVMVDKQVKRMVDEFAMEIASQGMQLQDYLNYTKKTIEDLYNETRGGALYRVQLNVAMKEIVKLENIDPTNEEVEEEIQRLAATYHMPEDRVRAAVPVENLKEDLALRKAADFVVEHAIENGSEPAKEGETIVVTKEDCEPEHHHHEDEEPTAEETPVEKKTTRKRTTKTAATEEDGTEKPKKRTTKKATAEEETEEVSKA